MEPTNPKRGNVLTFDPWRGQPKPPAAESDDFWQRGNQPPRGNAFERGMAEQASVGSALPVVAPDLMTPDPVSDLSERAAEGDLTAFAPSKPKS